MNASQVNTIQRCKELSLTKRSSIYLTLLRNELTFLCEFLLVKMDSLGLFLRQL